MPRSIASLCLLVTLTALALCAPGTAADQVRSKEAVVAGGPDAFMEVRHVVIEGSNFEIGRQIAELAKAAGFQLTPSADTLRARVQRQYLQQNYPILYERMRGLADGFGVDTGDSRYDLSSLFFVPSVRPGCSVGLEQTQGVGVHELASMRYLLDNCKDVPEAKQALLSLKHFYSFIPCHYIIGDSSGRSFIFEFQPQRNRVDIVDGAGPQCVTNHLVSKHGSVDDLPAGDSYDRYKSLHRSMTAAAQLTTEQVIAANAEVAVPPESPGNPQYAPGRTIWYSLYDLDERTMKVRFYLGERPDPANPGRAILEYSDFLEFRL